MTSAPGEVRVLLVDDHEIVRQGVARVLEETPGVRVVGQAGDGAAALALARTERPDVVVLDWSMPGKGAPEVIAELSRELPGTRVVVLTVHENIHYAVKALESGALGYVVKAAAVQELVDAVRAAVAGETFISPRISRQILAQLQTPRRERTGLAALSARELELLRLLGSGMGLKDCARHLDLTTSTLSTYRARLMAKLGLETTAALIRFAIENGLVG